MRYISFDCAVKNCGWSCVESNDKCISIIDFGLLNFSKTPECRLCDNTRICLNIDECELMYRCAKHAGSISSSSSSSKKKKTLTSQEVCENLISELNALQLIKSVDIVILENQPSFMNPISKAIQVMLLTYFTSLNKPVIIQNPNQKLFGYKLDDKKKTKYKERKTLSTFLVKNLIPKNDFNKLLQFSKIDDICDAILMCYHKISLSDKSVVDKINDILFNYKIK